MFSGVDTIWVLLGAAMVFFMQAGFAMVETGFTRAKNAGNIIMKNLMDFCIGTPVFFVIGFGIMFGADHFGLFGSFDFFVRGDYGVEGSFPSMAFLIFQTVFCATAATIVSGAMAERTKFLSYCLYSFAISLFIYPISGHWIWGGGWLSQLGFHDFAGSTAVHMVGGVAALVGAKILGPRIGKYSHDGKPRAMPGHSLTLGALGVFILWFCWFGFNGCSTVSMTGEAIKSAAKIFVTTNLSAACAACATMIYTWVRYKKPDVSMTLNGALAGLVAITAGCDTVSPISAAVIGLLAGILVVVGIEFVDKKLKIDDPVGAIGVHGICGAFGTIMVGLLSDGAGTDGVVGTLFGGGVQILGVQVLGVAAVIAWVAVMMFLVFKLIDKTIGLRVSPQEEIAGLDIEEHGIESSYADFMPVTGSFIGENHQVPVEQAVPVEIKEEEQYNENGDKIKKVVIVTRQSKFEELKTAMNMIGITGMTVSNVLGCGNQKGRTEFYRGVEVDMNLLPKIKVEIVICHVPLRAVIDTAKKVLYTGNIRDGKIFVYNIETAVKIRTGVEGPEAI